MKFLSRIKELVRDKKTPISLSAKVTPEMLAAGIVYGASSHVKGVETNLREFEKAAGNNFPLPDLESDAGFRTLEESIKTLWVFAHTRVLEHFQDSTTANLFHTLLVPELTKLASGCGVSLTEEKLMEAWRLYSPNSPSPPSKEEVLKDYAEYVIVPDIVENCDDWAVLTLNIFHARVLRALGLTISSNFILCEGLLAVNGTFLVKFRRFFEKAEPDFG
jgi:hypothetical protein